MTMTKLAAVALLAGAVCVGCAKDEKKDTSMTMKTSSAATVSPTTQPASPTNTAAAPAMMVPDKDMTHVLTQDEAYYSTSPAQARKPDGTLKAGTKVVLLMPRGSYAQVMTADGKRVYTSLGALKPMGS
jgi:hypothetical protein